MEKRPITSPKSQPVHTRKIYVVLVGSAPMASLDALMLSLERFKGILSSDSAKDRFETSLRTIKLSLREVDEFIDTVYAEKNPKMSISMTGRTLVIEIEMNQDNFLNAIDNSKVDEILRQVTAVGTMPAKKNLGQPTREYTAFPVKYANGRFIKT